VDRSSYPKLDKKTVLVIGTGRSGTTWLAGLLAAPFRYRLLFEPFQPHQVPGAEIVADRYIDPVNIPASAKTFIQRALNDEIDSGWIAQNSNRRFQMHRWRFWPRARIIKIIRGNLLVPALRAMYGPSLPIVLLVRHPGAVVESFLRVNFPWAFDLGVLLKQHQLEEKFGVPIEKITAYADDAPGKIAVRWAVENAYLLKYGEQFNIRPLYYEDLVEDPAGQIRRLCTELGLDVPKDLEASVYTPAYTTHKRSPTLEHGQAATGWRTRLSGAQINKVQSILDIAGVDYPNFS